MPHVRPRRARRYAAGVRPARPGNGSRRPSYAHAPDRPRLRRLRAPAAGVTAVRPHPAPRRRDPRRQPPLGPRGAGTTTAGGHRAGADKIEDFLGWCEEVGVEVVTLWLLSTDNLGPARGRAGPAARHHRGHRRPASPRRGAGGSTPSARSTCCPTQTAAVLKAAGRPTQRRRRAAWSTSRSATAAAGRSPTRCARCCRSTPAGAPRSRSWPRSSTSSTSPSTSTPAGSPTPTWSSAPPASSGCPASCSGRARTRSSTSARRTGRPSGRSTSCGRCATTRPASRRFGS